MKRFLIIFSICALFVGGIFLLSGARAEGADEKEQDDGISAPLSESEIIEVKKHQTISPEEANYIIEDEFDFVLIDVRTKEEFAETHIEGAILIPYYELPTRAETELPDKEARIVIYCQSGGRSATSAALLAEMGYINVFDMGGILDWEEWKSRQLAFFPPKLALAY